MTQDELKKLQNLQEEWTEAWKIFGDPRNDSRYEDYQKNQDDPMIQFANQMGRFSAYSNVANQLDELLKTFSK